MDLFGYWVKIQGHWGEQWREFRDDVVRLDSASRPFAAAALVVGMAKGLLPIAILVVGLRLVDGLIGSRGIGVQTSDLTHALWLVGVVWVLGMALVLGGTRLRGVIAKVAASTATFAFLASLSVCLFLIGPFRFVALLLVLAVGEALPSSRRTTGILLALILVLGISFFHSVTTFLVSRSVTVGGFILFAGATTYATTWLLARKIHTL